MAKTKTNNYQAQFLKLALKRLPHHIMLYLAAKGRASFAVRLLDNHAKKYIVGQTTLCTFSDTRLRQYEQTTGSTTLWHGTGRYQHGQNRTADVLDAILSSGAIRPVEDAYAIFSHGETMVSTSLTRLRVIARCYADIHGEGIAELNRYGNALTWISYHYGLFYARLYTRNYYQIRKHYKTWHNITHDSNGHNTWGKKANRNAEDVWDVFGLGSDIAGNYPIIFGIRTLRQTVSLSPIFHEYEVRTTQPITLDTMTHLEVPLAKVKEVTSLLKKYGAAIPVAPIELGEYAASKQSFSTLLGLTQR